MDLVSSPRCCTKEQLKTYEQWFSIADSDGDGRITGNDALKLFAMSKLSRPELKQVWAIADSKRQGYLGIQEFITAMQLISLTQLGHEITPDILGNAEELEKLRPPEMEGLDKLLAKAKRSPIKIDVNSEAIPKLNAPGSFSFFRTKSSKKIPLNNVTSIIDGLKKLYKDKLKPLETTYRFNDFGYPLLTNSDFDARPMVMLLGQYSTGKTTFIKHLLRTSYPGAHIGPEPTTDRFVVVMSGPDERSIPGNTITVQADMPFSGLTTFGTAFLSKFECSQMPHPLMRVYGALLWSMGKVLNTPEVMRVYIGSFNDKPISDDTMAPLGKELFEREQEDLISDLNDIPKKACHRRINEFVKRARTAKIHAYIISHLKKEMPAMMGKAKTQQRLIDHLEDEFLKIQKEFHIPAGDFPNVEHFKEVLCGYNFDKFEKLNKSRIQVVDDMLAYDIPNLLKKFGNPYN